MSGVSADRLVRGEGRGQDLLGRRDERRGAREIRELAGVLIVERGRQLQPAEHVVLQHDVGAGQPEPAGRHREEPRSAAVAGRRLDAGRPGRLEPSGGGDGPPDASVTARMSG